MPMVYGDCYIPWIGMGTNIRIGRIISMADIEAQPELRYEHSYAERTYDNGTRRNQVTAQADIIIHC